MEKKKNKTFVIMIVGVVCLILITLGLTYAYWRLTKEQTGVNVVNSDCFNIEFVGENDFLSFDKCFL